MSDLFDRAVASVRDLPPAAQDEAARLLLDWVGDRVPEAGPEQIGPEPIDQEHRAAIEEGLADVRAGRIASQAEVEDAFAAFRSR